MRENQVRRLVRAGEPALNAWVSSGSPYAAEVLSHAGYDAVTIDLQHGMFGVDGAIALLTAVSAGPAVPMVRCTRLDPAEIGKLLDAGAYGLICPSIDTAEQCAALVAACRYPPQGQRSYGPARGLLYGGPDYVAAADDTVQVWAMVESRTALENLESILAVPGLDGVYVGPNDLALSLGVEPGTVPVAPEVEDALARVLRRARAAGVAAGAYCADAAMARRLADDGFHLVTPGNDMVLLREGAARRLAEIRGRQASGVGGGY
ncbi:2,4-dihydroxyhept-2-ene-1,7-dioic acid aldolase [Streptomyces sp. 3MP-14]|uniref:2,4-dihydroxyhept-2-ene-1,7-dioic acid aldolase n=1 Tax=Streptomyces mimosae TaxID=2586635 RepID=A0A5N6A936_9ACTN|nr:MULTISPECIES: aldolase/citrate lyase family protein [Streptomyces]KAB8164513.1 2,4-dihydroxyhept-2-ene-1,7-dioic acid aldolase [Streptomyces mimosae]KAB8175429.1 2,4-dihydroxyhept-2-ene-1,7-dioic acid aldolase [Streptomyces sp. 3MP-14]